MTANEREDVEKIRKRWKQPMGDFARIAYSDADIESLLDIIDRHDRLANEGLNQDEQDELTVERKFWFESGAGALIYIAEKLQAQLAAALQLRDLLLSDPPASREDVVLAVREETARECAKLALDQDAINSVQAIRRRFGLAAPQPAEPKECHYCQGTGDGGPSLYCPRCGGTGRLTRQPAEPAEVCQRCNGSGHIVDFYPLEFGGQRTVSRPCPACNPASEPQPSETPCPRCEGSKEVARYRPSAVTTCCGRKTQTRSDINQSRDGIRPVWCSVCWATYLPEHSGYMPCPDCSGTDDRRSVRRCLEDRP